MHQGVGTHFLPFRFTDETASDDVTQMDSEDMKIFNTKDSYCAEDDLFEDCAVASIDCGDDTGAFGFMELDNQLCGDVVNLAQNYPTRSRRPLTRVR